MTLHPDLQRVLVVAILVCDFQITCGYRGKGEQNRAFRLKVSTKPWPESKHNQRPSLAVDVTPYPVRWADREKPGWEKDFARFYFLAGAILTVANLLKIEIRWGGDWDRDGEVLDNDFDDLGHFELVRPKSP